MPGERGGAGTPGPKGEKVSAGELFTLFLMHLAFTEQALLL